METERRSGEDRRSDYRGGRRATDVFPAPLHTLTTQQRRILEAIALFEREFGEACSARLLARRFNLHATTIHGHLEALYRRGWLKTPNAPATLSQPIE